MNHVNLICVVSSNENVAFCHVLDNAALNLSGTLYKKKNTNDLSKELQRKSIVEQIEDATYKTKLGNLHPETAAITAIINKRWDALVSEQGK
jgi:hypothetical protein